MTFCATLPPTEGHARLQMPFPSPPNCLLPKKNNGDALQHKWTYRASRPHRKLRTEQGKTQFGAGMTKVERWTDRILTPTLIPKTRHLSRLIKRYLVRRTKHPAPIRPSSSSHLVFSSDLIAVARFQRRKTPSANAAETDLRNQKWK